MSLYEVQVSGAYRNQQAGLVDFEEKILMPVCDEEWVKSNIINRCLKRHFEAKKAKRFDSNYSCFIDSVNQIEFIDKNKKTPAQPSCLGKNIKELNHAEIQEVAILYNLFRVPLYKACDLREAKRVCYREYANEILKMGLNEDFDFNAAPDLIIPETTEGQDKASIEIADPAAVLDGMADEKTAGQA